MPCLRSVMAMKKWTCVVGVLILSLAFGGTAAVVKAGNSSELGSATVEASASPTEKSIPSKDASLPGDHRNRHRPGNLPVHPIRWVVRKQLGRSAVRIGSTVAWCPDEKLRFRPHITGVKQVYRPRAVVLTAYLAQKHQPQCLLATPVEYVVHIRHGIDGRILYDGSSSPPVRRWPK